MKAKKVGFISFIDQVLMFITPIYAIDDAVDTWHKSKCDIPLQEYLGMTWEEYQKWVARPSSIVEIVRDREKSNTSSRTSPAYKNNSRS